MTALHPHASASRRVAFTLIELLIVVAIIAILAAIAVPNFLEAQTRSKISRSAADMRTIDTAIQAYLVDYNNEPKVNGLAPSANAFSAWWGFVSASLTTPVAYITAAPTMTFTDVTIRDFWRNVGGTPGNQPYTIIRDTSVVWPVGYVAPGPGGGVPTYPVTALWNDRQARCGYVIYTGGPDGRDMTVWGSPEFYDATNGTISYGDIYRFAAAGSKDEDDRTN